MQTEDDNGLPQGPVGASSGPDPETQRWLAESRKRLQLAGDHEDDTAVMQSPVRGFWERLIHGTRKQSTSTDPIERFVDNNRPSLDRVTEVGRSVVRGVMNLGEQAAAGIDRITNDTEQFKADARAQLRQDRPDMAVPEPAPKAPANTAAAVSGARDRVLGRRSDDPIAGLAEDVTQFAVAYAMTGGESAAGSALEKAVGAATRGAVVDATAFDPHQGGLAELAARSGLPGLKQLGESLSVGQDDSQVVARLKRAAAGIVPGVALDGLIHMTKLAWARGVLRDSKAAPAQKTLAETVEAESQKVLQDIADGTHTPEGATVVARPTEHGTWEIRPASTRVVGPDGQPLRVYHGTQRRFDSFDVRKSDEGALYGPGVYFTEDAEVASSYAEGKGSPRLPPKHELEAEVTKLEWQIQHQKFDKLDQVLASDAQIAEWQKRLASVRSDLTSLDSGPNVRAARLSIRNPLDIDAPVTPEMVQRILETEDGSFFSRVGLESIGERGATGQHLYDYLEAEFGGSKADVNRVLQAAGFDGITHVGGKITGGKAHRVWIAFSNEQIHPPWGELPKFSDRGEAEAQAETINMAHDELVQAMKNSPEIAPEALDEFRSVFRDLANANSPEALKDVLDRSRTVFSINLEEPTERTLAAARSIAKVWEEEVFASKMTVKQLKAKARQLLGGLTEDEAVGAMAHIVRTQTGEGREVVGLASDYILSLASEKVGRLYDIVDARPHDPVANEMLRKAVGKMLDLERAVVQEDSRAGRHLRFMQEREGFRKEMQGKSPFKAADVPVEPGAAPAYPPIEGLSLREIREIARITKMTGHAPRELYHVTKAAEIVREGGNIRAATEYFLNNVLSAPATAMTQLMMNATMTALRPAMRALGAAATGDVVALRESADLFVGGWRYMRENLIGAGKAWKASTSLLNPAPVRVGIGGHVAEEGASLTLAQSAENAFGTAVRLPTRHILALDELFKLTNYRSWVYAQSLKQWRAKAATWAASGMSQQEIEQAISRNVEQDVKNSINEHGIGIYEGGAKYADEATFQTPLGDNTIGGYIHRFVQRFPILRLIAPFVKTSVNLWRWNARHTPLLNAFNAEARQIMARGGADAAELHATSAMVGMMYLYSGYAFHNGDITGRPPADKNLRALWYKAGNTPYTLTVRNPWTGNAVGRFVYRRGDPIFMPLALVADALTAANELHDQSARGQADAEQVILSSLAGLAATMSSRSYLYSTSQFFEAWGRGDVSAMRAWTQTLEQGLIPEGAMLSAVNNDPYLREAHGALNQVFSRLPGWSTEMSPKYDLTGNPILKANGYQPLDAFPEPYNAKPNDVAQALYELKRGFSPLLSTRVFLNGLEANVTLTDKVAYAEGAKHPDMAPWDRLNEIIREPGNGRPGLEDALRQVIRSDVWKRATDGTAMYPGGTRWMLAAKIIDAYQQQATAQIVREYPKLREEVERQTIERKAAPGGEQFVQTQLNKLRH